MPHGEGEDRPNPRELDALIAALTSLSSDGAAETLLGRVRKLDIAFRKDRQHRSMRIFLDPAEV